MQTVEFWKEEATGFYYAVAWNTEQLYPVAVQQVQDVDTFARLMRGDAIVDNKASRTRFQNGLSTGTFTLIATL